MIDGIASIASCGVLAMLACQYLTICDSLVLVLVLVCKEQTYKTENVNLKLNSIGQKYFTFFFVAFCRLEKYTVSK